MNSPFKFPRRVRIHGGECGAVARALHHEAEINSLPAVSENVSFTTNERKSMSTKTSLLKRFAQTAVMALVAGLITSVSAPVSNAAVNSSISATCIARADVGGVILVSYKGDSITTLLAKQVSKTNATGVTYNLQDSDVIQANTDSSTTSYALPLSKDTTTAAAATITYQVWADKDGFRTGNLTATAVPDADALSTNVTCTVAGAPSTFSWSATTASAKAEETATVTVTPKDASGVTTLLNGTTESFTITATSTATANVGMRPGAPTNAAKTTFANGSAPGVFGSTVGYADWVNLTTATKGVGYLRQCSTLTGTACRMTMDARFADTAPNTQAGNAGSTESTMDSITSTGGFTFNVSASAAGTFTFTAAGQATTASMTSSTFTLTTTAAVYGTSYGFTTAALAGEAGYGIIESTEGWEAGAPDLLTAPTAAVPTGGSTGDATFNVSTNRTSIPLKVNYTTGGTFSYTVAAVTGYPLPTGITAGTYSVTGSSTDSITTIAFTTTTPSAGQRFKVTWDYSMGVTTTATFVYQAPQVGTSIGSIVITNDASSKKVLVTTGVVSAEATIRDQFGSLVSGATAIWSSTGRNASAASTTTTTNATGVTTYSYTDASTSATSLTDTVQIQVTSGNSGSYASDTTAFTFVTALAATTVTATAQDADGEITADDDSASWIVTVTDATGAALSGYPVVVSGMTNTYATSTTVYTSSTGTATMTVYGKTEGTDTLTFTSGGKTATGTIAVEEGASRTYAVDKTTVAMAPGDAPTVTVTVKDRYGNVVEGQTVNVTYVGTAGNVATVNGVNASSGTTNAAGQVSITLAGSAAGTGTLTVKSTMANASTATVNGNGSALPAKTASTGLTVAVTITGVSAIQTSVDAATDAAAEAIDAANAATDAANLAAEAADAATVAAEEARDAADAATAAVEELATQVATLMAALKAQITTLANTVAKIAKKVKA